MKRIIGAKFHSIRRVVDMLCFNLGNEVKDDEGHTYAEYALHIQISKRFEYVKHILRMCTLRRLLFHFPNKSITYLHTCVCYEILLQ